MKNLLTYAAKKALNIFSLEILILRKTTHQGTESFQGFSMPQKTRRRCLYKFYIKNPALTTTPIEIIVRKRLIVIVASAHKVGSTWLFRMLTELGHFKIKPIPQEFEETGTLLLETPKVFQFLIQQEGSCIFKSHSYPITDSFAAPLEKEIKFITIVRDPRDVVVSASFYLALLEKKKGGWGKEFRELTEADRILTLLKQADFLLVRLEKWFQTPIAYNVRYENLIKTPLQELEGCLDYLGFHVNTQDVENIIQKHSFKSKTGRNPGDEKKSAVLRKGIIGDWKNYFDQACITAFKTQKEGRWNTLLVEMGYEKHLNW